MAFKLAYFTSALVTIMGMNHLFLGDLRSLTIALLAYTALAQVLPDDCTRTYDVVVGDVCDAISAAQNVST